MSGYEKFYKARENIVDILRKDLIGPISADEVLHENPERYYIMGKLYPQRPDAPGGSGSMAAEEADMEDDSVINQSDQILPEQKICRIIHWHSVMRSGRVLQVSHLR